MHSSKPNKAFSRNYLDLSKQVQVWSPNFNKCKSDYLLRNFLYVALRDEVARPHPKGFNFLLFCQTIKDFVHSLLNNYPNNLHSWSSIVARWQGMSLEMMRSWTLPCILPQSSTLLAWCMCSC